MAVAKTPAPTFPPALRDFATNMKDVPYNDLLVRAAEAGWDYRLVQADVQTQPDASTLVTYDVLVGRTDDDAPYQFFDKVTMHLLASIGPVSLAGRLQALSTLIFLFFGRLPPAAPEQTVNVSRAPEGDIILPGERPLEPEQEYVPDSAPIDRRAKIMPDLVDHTEPDGVPIFKDLDDMPEQFTDAQIIAQLLEDIDKAAVRFDSIAQLEAMFTKNAPALGPDKEAFLMALGTPEDRTALKAILDKHQARIEAAAAPAREVRIPGGKGSAEASGPRRRRAA